jgi:hypothetical protein
MTTEAHAALPLGADHGLCPGVGPAVFAGRLAGAAAAVEGRPDRSGRGGGDRANAARCRVLAATNPEFRKAIIVCPGLASAPFVEMQTIENGEAGVRLVSACALPSEALRHRPGLRADTISARPPVTRRPDPVACLVELRHTPKPGRMAPPPRKGISTPATASPWPGSSASSGGRPFTLYALSSKSGVAGAQAVGAARRRSRTTISATP